MQKSNLIEPEAFIRELSHDIKTWQPNGRLVTRLEYPVVSIDPLNWLSHIQEDKKIYWSDRERRSEVAGVGSVISFDGRSSDELNANIGMMENILRQDQRLKFFGGIRFSNRKNGDTTWRAFPYFHFHLPVFEFIRRGNRYSFVCNLYQPDQLSLSESRSHYLRFIHRLFSGNGKADPPVRFIGRKDNPEQAEWVQNIQQALQWLDGRPLEKVVLARKSELTFSRPLKAERLLNELRTSNPNSFLFLFRLNKENAFLGSTPERLYKRSGRHLETEAVAGTRRRGRTPEEDRRLKEDLLHCEKDLREHAYVVRSIEQVLTPYVHSIQKDAQTGILENARVQHLVVRFKAELKEKVSDMDVLNNLHPTPAVGGVPKEKAIEKIHQLEHFDRGWYAGPVGWISHQEAEFAVGIRSALLQGSKVSLFAGAGIVQGSDPISEWREIENKIANFIKVLHVA